MAPSENKVSKEAQRKNLLAQGQEVEHLLRRNPFTLFFDGAMFQEPQVCTKDVPANVRCVYLVFCFLVFYLFGCHDQNASGGR